MDKSNKQTNMSSKSKILDWKIHLGEIMSSLPVCIVVIDVEEDVVYANATAESVFGIKSFYCKNYRCGDFISCVNRAETPHGCGYASKCPACPLLKAVRSILTNENAVLEEGEAELIRDHAPNPMWVKYHVRRIQINNRIFAILSANDITDVKQAEKIRLESLNRFQAVLSALNDAIIIVNPVTRLITEVNEATNRIFGYSKEEIVGRKTDFLHVDPAHFERFGREAMEAYRHPGYYQTDFQMRRKDGSIFPSEHFVQPVRHQSGRIEYVISVVRDVTERKTAEERIAWNANRNALLSKTASNLLQGGSPQKIVEELCEGVMDFLDCQTFFNFLLDPHEERLYLNAFAGIPDDAARNIERLDFGTTICGRAARDRRRIIYEDILHTNDPITDIVKSYGIQAYCCHPMMIEDRLIGTLSFGTRTQPRFSRHDLDLMREVSNLTAIAMDRIQREEVLLKSEQKFRNIFDNSSDAVFIHDFDGRFLEVNQTACQRLGYTHAELLRMTPMDIDDVESVHRTRERINALKEAPNPIVFEAAHRRKDGGAFPVEINSRQIEYEGRPCILSVARDITERKKAEGQLREMRMRTEAILNGIADTFYSLDNEWRFTIVNPAAELAPFGRPAQDLIGQVIWDLYPGLVDTDIHRHYLTAAENHSLEHYEARSPLNGRWYEVFMQGWQDGVDVYMRDITERKRAEDALRESNEKFRNLANLLPQIVFETDRDGSLTFANQNAFRTFGYTKAEFESGLHVMQMIAAADRNRAADRIHQIMSGQKEIVGNEYTALKKDGTEFPVIIYSSMILRDGVPAGLRGIMIDISDRKQAEDRLRKSEEKYRAIFENANEGILIAQGNRLKLVNKAAERIIGCPADILTSKAFTDFIHPVDRHMVFERYRKRLAGEIVDTGYEFRVITGTGEERWVEIHSSSLNWEDQPSTLNFIQDITDRKISAAERMKLISAVEQADEVFMITDVAGNIQHINSAFEQLTGYSRDEALGQNPRILKSGIHTGQFYRQLWDTILSGRKWQGRMTNKRKDGSLFTEDTTISPVFDDNGGITNFIAVKRDVTAEILMEKRIAQSQRMEAIGSLAGGIAHDFNNILFPIVGLSEMLMEDLTPGSPEHENVVEIYKAGKRGSDLVKQILAFSRQAEKTKMPIRIQQILKEVMKLSRATIPVNITISWDIQNDCSFVEADATQVHQIAMNLITNAYHAVEPNSGEIAVRLRQVEIGSEQLPDSDLLPGKYAMLSVSDTGVGIEPAILQKIFEPYFTTKEQGKGTGLGLAVVYGIVKEHHGDIKVDSTLGKGTTFNVYFPIMARSEKTVSIEGKDEFPTGHERILLVDDEEAIANLEKQVLERLGYNVTMRVNSLEALEAFKTKPELFDLVISDMTMPGMTGDRLARELISIRPDIPVIICTGFSERINHDTAESIGIKGFLMKPIIKTEIAKTVRKVLDETKR